MNNLNNIQKIALILGILSFFIFFLVGSQTEEWFFEYNSQYRFYDFEDVVWISLIPFIIGFGSILTFFLFKDK